MVQMKHQLCYLKFRIFYFKEMPYDTSQLFFHNHSLWLFRFYLLGDGTTIEFVKDREYLGTVQDIYLNGDYCAVR